MHTAKEYERIVWVHMQLKSSCLNKQTFTHKFGNKERTFHRDIEKLKNNFNAPIVFDRNLKNYYYTDKTFELPIMLLSEQELFSLLVSSQMLEQYKGTPLNEIFKKVVDRLAENLPTDIKYFYSKLETVQKSSRSFSWDILWEICKAISGRYTIEAEYTSFSSMNTSKREIDPYSIYVLNNEFYLVGFCHKHNQFRDFALSRFKKIDISKTHFKKQEFDISEYANTRQWGVLKGGELTKVRFKVTKLQQQWVNEKYKDILKLVSQNNEWIEYEVKTEINKEFINWILSLREEIVIESPDSLKKEIVSSCRNIIDRYES
jgi:predicted DNA-binding transcriptional regulator YafY